MKQFNKKEQKRIELDPKNKEENNDYKDMNNSN